MGGVAIFGASGGIGEALCISLQGRGHAPIRAGSRQGEKPAGKDFVRFAFDLRDEESIAAAAETMADDPPDIVIVATGVLTLPDGTAPERSMRQVDREAFAEAIYLNTIGPALIAKHVLPLFRRDRRHVFAVISAKVGSIEDNRIGGWHSYRASKAALNMLMKNFAIELGRTHPEAVVAALHPGTVDSALSAPFQANLPAGQLTAPDKAASNLLNVIDGLTPKDSGGLFAWDGKQLPY